MIDWHQREVPAMGTTATLIVGGGPPDLADWAVGRLAALEQCWSRFRPASELSELNNSAGRWFPMSETLGAAVDRALHLAVITDGRFDPTVHDSLISLGYDRDFGEIPEVDPQPAPPPLPALGVDGISRDEEWILLPEGVRLDLGGVGKGLAADLLAAGLVERGAVCSCSSFGGDIRVAGTPPGGGWRIPIAAPAEKVGAAVVHIQRGAIVASTTRLRRWRRGDDVLHHLIDPRTGRPTDTDVQTAIVVAGEAWLAEGLAKAAIVAGTAEGIDLLATRGAHGWLFDADARCAATPGAPDWLSASAPNAAPERPSATQAPGTGE